MFVLKDEIRDIKKTQPFLRTQDTVRSNFSMKKNMLIKVCMGPLRLIYFTKITACISKMEALGSRQ